MAATEGVAPAFDLDAYLRDLGVPPDRWLYYRFQSRRYGSIVQLLGQVGSLTGKDLLDLGGGIGALALTARSRLGGTYDLAEAEEIDAPRAAALHRHGIREYYRVELGRPGGLSALTRPYDVVLLIEVLEHLLVNPLHLFREIRTHLKPGGYLLITTPNLARLRNRLRLLAGRSIKDRWRYPRTVGEVNGHVIEYTRPELTELLLSEGFRTVHASVVQQEPSVRSTALGRFGVRLLDTRLANRWDLGDNIRGLYRAIEGWSDPPAPGQRV
ncbi:MAG TPA: class I SAM-dependent methyltransferase [Thermoplasmata archaeon]|nr:class I SAM-dependent methyltransferase [Thermoplasmata archaeon]